MTTPDPTRWFTDLLNAQQTIWKSLGTAGAAPDAAAPPAATSAGAASPWPNMPWPQVPGIEALTAPWLESADQLASWQTKAWGNTMALWGQAVPGAGTAGNPADADKRFASQAWRNDPRFDGLARGYLGQSEMLHKMLETAPLDERSKAQMGFMLRQVVDALSPANCLATNPEALQTAIESGGASLAEGMRLFMQDLARGKVSMTDDQAFEVGRNVATSPGSVVYENELMQLIQYKPSTPQVYRRPLVIVPPCINKYYILDLQPDNSFVGYAAAQGHTVFLVSWRNMTTQQGHLRWDDYVEDGVLQAIDTALAISRADRVNALGFCVGGTLLASALAVLAARGEAKAASLTLLTTLLDFTETGELGLMVSEASCAAREAAIGQGGLLEGRELAQVFAALRANDLIWPYVVSGYLKGKPPPAFDLLFWNDDATNLPGPMACWYLRNMYLENKLREPGGTVQCGVPVDLGHIDVPAFLYASREDHIVPWQSAYLSTQLLRGDTRFVLGASGHIAGVINPPAKKKRSHWVGKLQPDASSWIDKASNEPGSWWPAWSDWLAGHAGEQRAARKTPGNRRFPVIEPAPGRYVKAKAA